MKKALLAGAAIAALALGAFPAAAADLSNRPVYKAPTSVPLVYNWTGFYIGGHVGYGWGSDNWNQTATSGAFPLDRSVGSTNLNGFLGGGQIGANWQSGMWVFGIEGDWSWTDANGCSNHAVFTTFAGCTNTSWYATATGRVGVAFDRSLLYVKGGAAFADQDHLITNNGVTVTNNPSNTRTGWTVGAGLEYALMDNWSVKVEYNYMDFGSESTTLNYTGGLTERWDIDQQVHVVKLGLNYRFR